MAMNISVTWLSSYIYCKRKFFLENVLGISEPQKDIILKGKIKHGVYDLANKQERGIVLSIVAADKSIILEKYKNAYMKNLKNMLLIHKSGLEELNLKQEDVFDDLWAFFNDEAEVRAENIFCFADKTKLLGKQLWDSLTPKIESEFYIESDALGLKGKVDRVEKYSDSLVPVELKAGSAPKEGVWEGHLIQLGAYIMLLEEMSRKKIDKGKVVYLSEKDAREVRINPFVRDEIKRLVNEVNMRLEKKELPAFTTNRKKCDSCGLRQDCFNL